MLLLSDFACAGAFFVLELLVLSTGVTGFFATPFLSVEEGLISLFVLLSDFVFLVEEGDFVGDFSAVLTASTFVVFAFFAVSDVFVSEVLAFVFLGFEVLELVTFLVALATFLSFF